MTTPITFDNSYTTLPDRFFARVRPAGASAPRLMKLNHALAEEDRAAVAELGREAPELVAGIGGRDRGRALGDPAARQHFDTLRAAEPVRIDAEFFRQDAVELD